MTAGRPSSAWRKAVRSVLNDHAAVPSVALPVWNPRGLGQDPPPLLLAVAHAGAAAVPRHDGGAPLTPHD